MKEKIVFLDAATVDYGDIDFSEIEALGEFTRYDTTAPSQVIERCAKATIAITNKVVFDADILNSCPELKLIAPSATGYNHIDIVAAGKNGIAVANVPGYSTESVAQLTMSFILALSANLIKYNEASHDGTWSSSKIYTLSNWPFFELSGKTIGIMGLGAIGGEVARLCTAFGLRVAALKRKDADQDQAYPRMEIAELAAESDFISIHMPLTDYSKGLINADFFKLMKPDAFLINMARGPIVDQRALLSALETGAIAGAAIDVMEKEPPSADDPLLKAPNLIITPHIAWAGLESRRKLVSEIAENIRAFLRGEKRNIVTDSQ